jgi:hypothetical protein
MDVYANSIECEVKKQGVVNPSYLVKGRVGNQSFEAFARNQSELPLASSKVLLGLVVLSIAPVVAPSVFDNDGGIEQ